MKDKCTKKIYSDYHSIYVRSKPTAVWKSDVLLTEFYVVDVDRIVGIAQLLLQLTLFYGSLSTDPILFTCVPHHLLSSAWPWERSRSFERSTFSLTCNKLSTAVKNTEAEPVVCLSCLFIVIITAVNIDFTPP